MENLPKCRLRVLSLLLSLTLMVGVGNLSIFAKNIGTDATVSKGTSLNLEQANTASDQSLLLPVITEEDTTKRVEYEKHFLCDDGSYMAITYPQPVHIWQDDEWVDADFAMDTSGTRITSPNQEVSLAKTTDDEAGLVSVNVAEYELSWSVAANYDSDESSERSTANEAEATVKTSVESAELRRQNDLSKNKKRASDLVARKEAALERLSAFDSESLPTDEALLADEINQAIEAANLEKIQDFSLEQASVEYAGALGENTTLRYIVSPGKVKEEIVLESRNGFVSYTASMSTGGLTAVLQDDNGILLQDEFGETVAAISPPYMYDARFKLSSDFEVAVQQDGDELVITYTPDTVWLDDAERAWPVVIDPTVTTLDVDSGYQDNYVNSQHTPNYTPPANRTYLEAGWDGMSCESRSFWKHGSSPSVPTGYSITDVSYFLRIQLMYGSSLGEVSLHRVIQDYSIPGVYPETWDSETITWNNQPQVHTTPIASTNSLLADGWLKFDLDLNAYMSGIAQGFRISSAGALAVFYSSNCGDSASIPYLAITYAPTSQSTENVSGGIYRIGCDSFNMEVEDGGTSAGTPVIQGANPARPIQLYQAFRLVYIANGEYKIEPVYAPGMVLALDGNKQLVLEVDTSTNLSSKRWLLDEQSDGKYIIVNAEYPTESLSGDGADSIISDSAPGISWDITPYQNRTPIAAGRSHTLMIDDECCIWAWGVNEQAQLGDGTWNNSNVPKNIGFNGAVSVATGYYHSLAIDTEGKVWAWGHNAFNQLGFTGDGHVPNPTQVPFPAGAYAITMISANYYHSMALTSSGEVYIWGMCYPGNGNGNSTLSSPALVPGLSGIVSIAAGLNQSYALKADGTVWAWGANSYGQLGDGTNVTSLVPQEVPGLSGIVAIEAGDNHVLALNSDGEVFAWGNNSYGQLGDGTMTDRNTPTLIVKTGFEDIVFIEAGDMNSFAITDDGTFWSWGCNWYGQLGDGSTDNRKSPVEVAALEGAEYVSAGYLHTAVMMADGSVWTMGQGTNGRLGIGEDVSSKSTPVEVEIPFYITIDVGVGDYLSVPVAVSNVINLNTIRYVIAYDPNDFELITACEYSSQPVLVAGAVQGTDVNVISLDSGVVSFEVDLSSVSSQAWSGVLNSLKLRAKRPGELQVYCYRQ